MNPLPLIPLVLSLTSNAPAALAPWSGFERALELTEDATLTGEWFVSELHVPAGVTLFASGDLFIHSRGPISIEGDVRGLPTSDAIGAPGANVSIVGQDVVRITGVVSGGSGWSWDGTDANGAALATGWRGGDGGNVLLEAHRPSVLDGRVQAGDGGHGGYGADGGRGGSVWIQGSFATSDGEGVVRSGCGGDGGPGRDGFLDSNGEGGGNGGDAGDVRMASRSPLVRVAEVRSPARTIERAALAIPDDGEPGVGGEPDAEVAECGDYGGPYSYPPKPCANGKSTSNSVTFDCVASGGGTGGGGGAGTAPAGNGGWGGFGGAGGSATASGGRWAQDGGDCCNPPAQGGSGGDAATGHGAVGGRGGNGGPGGPAYFDNGVYYGEGGTGGNAGRGGDAVGGAGGKGGKGGDGDPIGTGGSGGQGGHAREGRKGNPGLAGPGNPPGHGGQTSSDGNATPGTAGDDGVDGSPCVSDPPGRVGG